MRQKRKRRDYRIARKAAFTRPEPGLYEGRTRGKKLKYTYSDDEDIFSDGLPPATRRSTRARNAPEALGESTETTRFSSSGRPIRSRAGGVYGESQLVTQQSEDDASISQPALRERRTRTSSRVNGYSDYKFCDSDDESEAQSNGEEWQAGDEGEENDYDEEDEVDVSGDESVVNGNARPPSLVVQLRYAKGKGRGNPTAPHEAPPPEQAPVLKEEHPLTEAEQPAVDPQASSVNPDANAASEVVAGQDDAKNTKAIPQTESNGVVQNNGDNVEVSLNAKTFSPSEAALPARETNGTG